MEKYTMDKTSLSNIRKLYNNVVWTHKIQEKESDILHKKQVIFNVLSIILLSLTSSGILSTIFINEIALKIISAIDYASISCRQLVGS